MKHTVNRANRPGRYRAQYFFVLFFVLAVVLQNGHQSAKAAQTNSHTARKPGKKRRVEAVRSRSRSKARAVTHTSVKRNGKTLVRATEKKAGSSVMALPGLPNARVAVRSQRLKGAVFYLVSGHGGPDPGAIGHYGKAMLPEDEYAYDVTIRLARALMEYGATVYMILRDPNDGIRNESVLKLDHDEVTYPNQSIPLNQLARLRQGTDAVNRLHRKHKGAYQRLITIHVDSRSAGQNIDVFFYHHQNSAVGKRLAQSIHRSFTAGYKRSQPGRHYAGTVSDRSALYVVRNSQAPTVFIELGNIRNEKDQRRFLLADNRQALANWICEGVRADYSSR